MADFPRGRAISCDQKITVAGRQKTVRNTDELQTDVDVEQGWSPNN